ncbi:choline kinase [Williamsoniiplasma somnilux]|uniref:Choline kinase n=1 Tax=Williamsoniiplasma somnilux TaxID=215578 RepID=A0A2K8NY09_9MOLU|nr:phosphotransferase [Williamsoniiplasma somnilux]ATZ18709.1 choline kinase [Williamsoniiplasma somnilux]
MPRIKLKGLTNKLIVKNNLIYKTSNKKVDYFLNRRNESNFYKQMKQNNSSYWVLPTEYYFNQRGRFVSVYNYLPNSSTLWDIMEIDQEKSQKIINLITNFHKLDLDLEVFKPLEFLMLFKTKVKEIKELKKYDHKIEMVIKDWNKLEPVVSHNDLVRGNFLLVNEEWKLIDFEYVKKNHPLFDFASFISESCSLKEANIFLKELNLTQQELKVLNQIIIYQNYLWAYWAKYMYKKTYKCIYKKIMKEKINAILTFKKT